MRNIESTQAWSDMKAAREAWNAARAVPGNRKGAEADYRRALLAVVRQVRRK